MKQAFLTALACSTLFVSGTSLKVDNLRVDSQTNPVGVSQTPRLSWNLISDERGKFQSAYEILAASSAEKLDEKKADLWKSGKQKGAGKLLLTWKGSPLKNGQKVFWQVRTWEKSEEAPGPWSKAAHFTVGGKMKLSQPKRASSFETNLDALNQLYATDVALLGKRINTFTKGDLSGLGTGAQVHRSARSLLYNYHSAGHLTEWLKGMDAGVTKENLFPIQPGSQKVGPMSSDAGLLVTHPLWWMGGDITVPRDRWPIYENYAAAREKMDDLFKGKKWGELGDTEGVSPEFLDLCYLGLNCRLALELALPATQPEKSIRFQIYAARVRQSFARQFVNKDGSLKTDSQTGHVLALRSAVLNKEQKNKVLANLLASIKKNGSQVGPIGAYFLPAVLSITGNQDLAIESLVKLDDKGKKSYPGNGISEWLLSHMAGIDTIAPGFKQVIIAPRIPSGDSLKWVKAHYDSASGKISVHWKKLPKGGLKIDVQIPSGILSRISLPIAEGQQITEGGTPIKEATGMKIIDQENGRTTIITQSGKFSFLVK